MCVCIPKHACVALLSIHRETYNQSNYLTPQLLDSLSVDMITAVRGNIESEFDSICAELSVGSRLNELDRLEIEQRESREPDGRLVRRIRPATQNPLTGLKQKVLEARRLELEQLRAAREELTSGNAALEEEVDELHARAVAVQARIDESRTKMKSAADIAEGFHDAVESASASAAQVGAGESKAE